jgi:pilus assembly protein Flp/PilA
MNTLVRLFKDDEGATMVEYAIMVSLIAAICVSVVSTLGQTTSKEFSTVNASL